MFITLSRNSLKNIFFRELQEQSQIKSCKKLIQRIDMKKKILYFVLIPATFNLLFICLYFSGIDSLQQLIVPKIESLYRSSWREFGIVEQLQNLFLVSIIFLFISAGLKRDIKSEKIFFYFGSFIILFIFLEEIDYGLHFAHYFFNNYFEIHRFNLHNQHTFSEHENIQYIKMINDSICIIWFIIIPLFKHKFKINRFKSIIPSRWIILTVIISFIFSSLAHYLNDQCIYIFNNHPGELKNNISEFRETTTYYFYLLYALQLVKETDLKKINNITLKEKRHKEDIKMPNQQA